MIYDFYLKNAYLNDIDVLIVYHKMSTRTTNKETQDFASFYFGFLVSFGNSNVVRLQKKKRETFASLHSN